VAHGSSGDLDEEFALARLIERHSLGLEGASWNMDNESFC
jgi:hypothetical protein